MSQIIEDNQQFRQRLARALAEQELPIAGVEQTQAAPDEGQRLAMNDPGVSAKGSWDNLPGAFNGPQPLWEPFKTPHDEYLKRLDYYKAMKAINPNWRHPDEAPPMYLNDKPDKRGVVPLNPAYREWLGKQRR